MWRLLIVLALCGASLAQGEQHVVFCSNITTLQNVSLTELQGTWVARKAIDKDPVMAAGCYLNEISNTSDNGLKMNGKFYVWTGDDADEFTVESTNNIELRVIGENKGRLTVKTDKKFIQSPEMLIVSADPSSHLVTVMCRPPRLLEEGQQTSDDIGENFVLLVVIFARRQGRGDSGNLSEENLAKIVNDTIETLGLQSYHVQETLQTYC